MSGLGPNLPPTFISNVYNPNNFITPGNYLTLAQAQTLFLQLTGGTLSGLLTCNSSLTVNGILTLNGSNINTALSYVTGVTPGTVTASKALVVDTSLNISTFNSLTSTTLITTNFTFNSTNMATPFGYITSITPGTGSASKALVLDSSSNLTTGINNITLNELIVYGSSGKTTTLVTDTSGNFTITSYNNFTINAGSWITTINHSLNLNNFDGATYGLKLAGVLVTSSASQLNYVNVTAGTATASKALVLDSSGNLNNGSINGLFVSGTLNCNTFAFGSYNMATAFSQIQGITAGTALGGGALVCDVSRTITNIYSLTTGTLVLGSTVITASGNQLNYNSGVTAGTALAGGTLVLDSSKNITGINQLYSTIITALSTDGSGQINLVSQDVAGLQNWIEFQDHYATSSYQTTVKIGQTIGSNNNQGYFSVYTQHTNSGGSLKEQTRVDDQGNYYVYNGCICQGGSTDTSRAISCLNSSLSGTNYITLGQAATGNNQVELGFSYVSSGSSSNSFTVGFYGSNRYIVLTANGYLGIFQQTSPAYPLDVGGYISYSIANSTAYGYLNPSGAGNASSGATFNASCRMSNSVILTSGNYYSVSDRRMKTNIKGLDKDKCLSFVKNIQPSSFNKCGIPEIGYIAQDVAKVAHELIGYCVDETMIQGGEDEPGGVQLTVSYEKVCVVLHSALKDALSDIEELKTEIKDLQKKYKELIKHFD